MFNWMLENEKDFATGMDVRLQLRGITGLLSEDEIAKTRQATLGMIMNGVDRGVIPKEVETYAVRQELEAAGIPADQLGMSDSLLDYAVAQSHAMPMSAAAPMGQVPALDGRSNKGLGPGTVLNPSGGEQA
jgi:hypothetical protein